MMQEVTPSQTIPSLLHLALVAPGRLSWCWGDLGVFLFPLFIWLLPELVVVACARESGGTSGEALSLLMLKSFSMYHRVT